MMRTEPEQLWWTAEELARSGLPEMPGTKQGVNQLATRYGWRVQEGCARKKAGRGGGWQYHWSVLPDTTRKAMLARLADAPEARPDRGAAWAAFDALPETVKQVAKDRLNVLSTVELLLRTGATKVSAIDAAAMEAEVSPRAVYDWFKSVEGIAPEDRLAYLVPRHRLAERKRPAQSAREFMEVLQSLYLRLEQPTFRQSYRDAVKFARAKGFAHLAERTARRKLERDVPHVTRVFLRQGVTGLQKCFPPQIRDKSGMHALEGVNADCHKIDIFVRWPDGTEDRPQIVAFQDIYSGKILSWRVDHDPNKVMVMAAFGEMIEKWGIPRHCLFDNGHEFANKWMTAGTATRFRFKVREDDPLGVLPLMGIQVHWASPAHGQAKPIERGFRDFASDIAKDPRFAGAYVGNRPDAKPENYKSRMVPLEDFLRVVAEGIEEHNARQGRLSPTANGRSFDETFAESYQRAPIQKATEAQRRLWMMGQHVGTLNRHDGRLKFYGNVYHSDWMSQTPGKRVVARFFPDDLHAGVEIYTPDGEHLGFAECQQKVGFFDLTGARETARRRSQIQKAERQLAKAHAPLSVRELAEMKDGLERAPLEPLEAKVVAIPRPSATPRPVREAKVDPAAEAMRDELMKAERETATVHQLPAKQEPEQSEVKTSADRFWWAQSVLARSAEGQPIGSEEARQLRAYTSTAEYQANLEMFETYGAAAVR